MEDLFESFGFGVEERTGLRIAFNSSQYPLLKKGKRRYG